MTANPQLEEGYTRLANELLEALCRSDFAGVEFRILLFVIRSTYGFKKKSHSMSYQFIADGVGISRRSAIRSVKLLVTKQALVTNRSLVKGGSNEISLNKNHLQWATGGVVTNQSLVTNVVKSSDKRGKKVVTDRSPKKDKIKKKNKKEKGEVDLLSLRPDWLDEQTWADWIEHRKQIKKPLTKLSATKAINAIDKLRDTFTPEEVVDNAIEKGWQGIYPPSKKHDTQTRRQYEPFPQD